MSLISTLKSILGLGDAKRSDESTSVTVERETDARSERAVKESGAESDDSSPTEAGEPSGSGEASEPAVSEEAEEPSVTEEIDDSTGAGEADDSAATEEADEPADAGDTEVAGDSGAPENADEPAQTISGIGPAYAERLSNAGIETVGDLAEADPETLAAETDISETRIAGWIERASN